MLGRLKKYLLVFVFSVVHLFLVACSSIPAPEQRYAHADALALNADFQKTLIQTGSFTLLAYTKFSNTGKDGILRVYIEGDGYAFNKQQKPSTDPTPVDPLALRLAVTDDSDNVVYIARPCQYVLKVDNDKCSLRYWTSDRFSAAVIKSMNQAVDILKARSQLHSNVKRLELFGYSGGGAVVSMLALRRDDVSKLVTIAGNLDHVYWTRVHHYTPLSHSLNAADFSEPLSLIKQTHFVGADDRNIDRGVLDSYLSKMKNTHNVSVIEMKDFDHSCCWVKQWRELLNMMIPDIDDQLQN